jgi:hypothetical protein
MAPDDKVRPFVATGELAVLNKKLVQLRVGVGLGFPSKGGVGCWRAITLKPPPHQAYRP